MNQRKGVEYRLVLPGTAPGTSILIDYFEGQDPHEDGRRRDLPMNVVSAVQQSLSEGWKEKESAWDGDGQFTLVKLRRLPGERLA